MFRFEKRLTQIFLKAREQALKKRSQDVITTSDLFAELVEDSESLIYPYLSQASSEGEIFRQLESLRKIEVEDVDTEETVSFKFSLIKEDDSRISQETFLTRRLYDYVVVAYELVQSVNKDEICAEEMLLVIIQDPIKPITRFLRRLKVDIPGLRETFESSYYDEAQRIAKQRKKENTIIIPKEMKLYLSILEGDDTVLGRDKEIGQAWNILLKKRKNNVMFIGDPGVGKTAIAQKMVSQIKNGTSPEEFEKYFILALDVNAINSGTKNRGDSELRFMELINFIREHKNVIIFIDEVHQIIGAGRASGTDMNLANALKPLLAGDNSRVMAATTKLEYKKYFSEDSAIRRRFENVEVEEPVMSEVYPMIKARVDDLAKFHNVKISRSIVDFIALYASCFSAETKNPDRTIDLIDRSMVVTKRNKKRAVDKESVLANFKVNMELFEEMTEDEKKSVAYHEAGHYIAFSFLPLLKRIIKPVVVSIYPAEGYLGINITEERKNAFHSRSKQEYLEKIAAYLVGGIAESIVNEEPNSGVSSDSEHATEIAKHLVSKTGFYHDFFYSLDSLETEKSVEEITREIKEILIEAKQIAENVINEHLRELDVVVNALMEEHVISDEDLKVIMAEAVQTDVQKQTMTT